MTAPHGPLVILVDDDGDEFPMWRFGLSDEQVMARAAEFVAEDKWRPNGELRILKDRDA